MSHKQVQQIRGTSASLATYVPLQGELVIDLDTGNMHVGNGLGGRWIFEPLPGRDYVGRAVIGITPPANPFPGVFWWDSSDTGGQLYLWYDDGSSASWIAATNQVAQPPPPPAAGDPGSGTIIGVFGAEGLIGGSSRGKVTLGLEVPVAVSRGGTGATTPADALISLGALPTAGGIMTGALGINLGGPYQPIGYPLLFLASNDGPEGAGAMLDATGSSAPFYLCRFGRGSSAAPQAVELGDVLGSYGVTGRQATRYSNRAANIEMIAIEPWSDTAAGAAIRFCTNAPGAIESTPRAQLGQGLILTTAAGAEPIGGDLGPGTLNAGGIYIDGEPAATKHEVEALSAAVREVQALATELRERLARIEQSHAP